jgi:tight adherence protein C
MTTRALYAALALSWAGLIVAVRWRWRPLPTRPRTPRRPPRLPAPRRRRKRERAAIEADLPEVVDLLRMCVGAGLTVSLAVQAVARRADGPVARALGQAAATARDRGCRLADELDALTDPTALGEPARSLVGVLTGCERYGHAIGPALERLAAELRSDERRRAEAAARRVPVLLLFPLVTCILPAFALLTVAPLLANALGALRL